MDRWTWLQFFIANPFDTNQNNILGIATNASNFIGVFPLLYSQAFYIDETKAFWQSQSGNHIVFLEFAFPVNNMVQLPVWRGFNYSRKVRSYTPDQALPGVALKIH